MREVLCSGEHRRDGRALVLVAFAFLARLVLPAPQPRGEPARA